MSRGVFIAIIIVILAAAGFFAFNKNEQPATETVIAEAPAEPVSGVHLDALDLTTRAQDDFYQYANGGWLDSTEIPEIYSGYTVYHEVFERTEVILRAIIKDAATNPGEPGSESQKVGDLFASYLDEDVINSLGVTPMQPEFDKIKAVDSQDALLKLIANFMQIGVGTPFFIDVFPDLKDSTQYAIYFNQSGITLPDRDYYLDKSNDNFTAAREALPIYMRDMLIAAGYAADDAESAAKTVYAMEYAMAEAHWDKVKNRDPEAIYNPYDSTELSQLGDINWNEFRNDLAITATDMIVIQQPSFIESLVSMINERPLEDWKHYFTYNVMDSSANHLDQASADIRFAFRNRLLNGQQEERPRWRRGVSLVNALLGEAVGKLYVAEHFPPEAKAKMEEMVDNLLAEFDRSIDELTWMSAETKIKAKEKRAKFSYKIGYPNEWKDYSSMEIVHGNHVNNLRNAAIWQYQQEVGKLGKPIDKNEWFMNPQTVNAYYDPTQNEIVFPAARLQPPFFQLNADDAINYGAVGGVIGHEVSHGFDDSGSKFDGDGNLTNWWTEADREAFEALTNALVEQYNQFSPVEGMTVNGEFTLGENIGDLSGVQVAYKTYIRSLNGAEPPVIDGFTGPQRFFIGYAMSRKGKYHDESIINRLASDPHSPLEFRVIGPYRNSDGFHEAFGTQEGDGMWLSPEDRVKIW